MWKTSIKKDNYFKNENRIFTRSEPEKMHTSDAKEKKTRARNRDILNIQRTLKAKLGLFLLKYQ